MLCYLGGTMSEFERQGCFDKATSWRIYVTRLLNDIKIATFNPCIGYELNKTYDPKGVVNQNLCYLKKADIMLINLKEIDKSYGSCFELFFCYLNHIPVIAFGDNYLYGTQPHISIGIELRFLELDDAVDYIKSMYCQDNQ